MGAAAVLSEESLTVEPGGMAVSEIRVRNTGEIVDQFTFDALGVAAEWATFDPPSLSLFPDAEGSAVVRFAPPRRATTPIGSVPFGTRVNSKEEPEDSVVVEGDLVVSRFDDSFAELIPRTSQGRIRGIHNLAVDNRGNGVMTAMLTGIDPDERLDFRFRPKELTVEPGMAGFSAVEVRPRHRFLRGAAVTHPFRLQIEPMGLEPFYVDGAMLQEPLLPKWLPKAVLALAALVAAWFAFLRPTVQSTAKTAVREDVEAVQEAAAALTPALAANDARLAQIEAAVGVGPGAGAAPAPDPGAAGGGGGGEAPAPTTTLARSAMPALGDPFDARLEARNGTPSPRLRIEPDQALSVTDIVLQNPAGDAGVVSVQRGDQVLFQVRLETFRDLDYHFVSPLAFPGGSEVRLVVRCENPAGRACEPAMYLSGFMRTIPQT